ncbi:hypothetical protein HMPREF1982_03688 [Clostridiales bacterium oral taxon 876 str. F0540]|nr:hypothetical protein HMPREF1982_03688 [Clostridiales bacterium oral taxon 876 str. F0540]
MVCLNNIQEELLKILLDNFHENGTTSVAKFDYEILPLHIRLDIHNVMNELQELHILVGFEIETNWDTTPYTNEVIAILTPYAKKYFSEKETNEKKQNWKLAGGKDMFRTLTPKVRALFAEILENRDNLDVYFENKFEDLSYDDDVVLRGMISELIDKDLISVPLWAENLPYNVSITYNGTIYFEQESEFEKQKEINAAQIFNIDTFNAHGSNVTFGNVINSTQSIDNSIEQVKKLIDEHGGDDKKELNELLEDIKEICENINETKTIHKNSGLMRRLNKNIEKHGWFYSSIIQLLGKSVFQILG